jgi:hypothetical protein
MCEAAEAHSTREQVHTEGKVQVLQGHVEDFDASLKAVQNREGLHHSALQLLQAFKEGCRQEERNAAADH